MIRALLFWCIVLGVGFGIDHVRRPLLPAAAERLVFGDGDLCARTTGLVAMQVCLLRSGSERGDGWVSASVCERGRGNCVRLY